MEAKKIEEFAKKQGFDKVEYLGRYKNQEIYKPLHEVDELIGYPVFILIVKGKPKLIIDSDLKITKKLQNN